MESQIPSVKARSLRPSQHATLVVWLGVFAPLLLLISSLLLVTLPVAAHPQGSGDYLPVNGATLSIGSGDVAPGATIVVPLTARLGGEILGETTVHIEYDPAVLDATDCTADPGGHFDVLALCNTNLAADKVQLQAVSSAGVSGDIVLAQITFQAVGGSGESSPLTLTADLFSTPEDQPIAVTLENGQINIVAATLPAPSNLSATAIGPVQIDLTWDDNSSDETAFRVERSPNGSTGWAEIASVGADVTIYSDAGLTCGTDYYYRVRAYRAGDGQSSAYSNVDSATPSCTLAAPLLSWPADGSTTYETAPYFAWSVVSGATSYRLQVDDSAGFPSPEVDVTTPISNHRPASALSPGIYNWRVQASNAQGDGPWSSVWSVTIGSRPQPQILTLMASPAVIPPDGLSVSTLAATVWNSEGDPVDDGSVVVFSTTLGTFPGGLAHTPEPTGVMTVEAESNAVNKVGTWVEYSDPQASDGKVVYSNGTGDKVTYLFTGTAVSVIFQKQFNCGVARVYLDGLLYREIDTYWDDGSGGGKLHQREELIAEGLSYAPHLVEVVVSGLQNPASTGAYLVVDAFRIYGNDRNGAYLTSDGISTSALTSAVTPGTAVVIACAGAACDSRSVRFSVDTQFSVYLPRILRNYTPSPRLDCEELIENGGFEDTGSWYIGPTPRPARHTSERAYSGSHSMLLGLKPGETDVRSFSSVQQTITLPVDIYSATLSFWTYPVSDLDDGDRQDCLLLDEDDHLIAVLMRTNTNSTTWMRKSYDLTAYAGQTVKVYFNAYNDGGGGGVTGFYLDDVSVKACTEVGPPPPSPDCYPVLRKTVGVGDTPHGVALNGDIGRLYVANHDDDTLSVINSATFRLISSVAVGDGPNGVAYNPANRMIYVANRDDNTVTVLRASNHELIQTILVGSQPDGLAVNAITNRVYVANFASDTVSVIDGASNTIGQTIPVGTRPSMIAVNPITNKAYVALHGEDRVAVIDGTGNVNRVDIHGSIGSYGITVDTVRNLVYVATIETARIVAIDGSTDTFLGWAQVSRIPGEEPAPLRMIAVNPHVGTSGHIFVTTTGEDGGWNKFLLLPKGWPEFFGPSTVRPLALDLNEPQEGIVFDPDTKRVFATSRSDDLLAVYLDGEPTCPSGTGYQSDSARLGEYQITVCVAGPNGTCQQTLARAGMQQR